MLTLHFLQTLFCEPHLHPNVEFTGISTDTRQIKPGNLFIALKGEHFDAHDFIPHAIAQGARGIIAQKPYSDASIPTFVVPDTIQALGQIAKAWRSTFTLPLIALTGSCGKTTTKTLIASILNQVGPTLATQGTLNNHIGVPLTLLRLVGTHQFAVIELGANHPGEIDYVAKLTQPTVGLITNAGPVHLEGFGSLQGVATAKGELYAHLSPEGTGIINLDDPFAPQWKKIITAKTILSFGFHPDANINIRDLILTKEGHSQFTLITPDGEVSIHLPLLGRHNVSNALAAAAAATAINLPLGAIKSGLEQASPPDNRLSTFRTSEGALVINDTYNANPIAFKVAIQTLMHFPGKKILVMGDMAELGEKAPAYHHDLGQEARESGVDVLLATGPLSRHAAKGFGPAAIHFEDKHELAKALKKFLTNEAIVLIKGSRSAKMEEVVEEIQSKKSPGLLRKPSPFSKGVNGEEK